VGEWLTEAEIRWLADQVGWRGAQVVDGPSGRVLAYEVDTRALDYDDKPLYGSYPETASATDLRELAADLLRLAEHLELPRPVTP
jgi:hypothetical protein